MKNAAGLPEASGSSPSMSTRRSTRSGCRAARITPGQPPREHSLVAGLEVESADRRDARTYLDNGVPVGRDSGDTFRAQTLRTATYVQDEWNLNANWAFHAGLRWEGIETRGVSDHGFIKSIYFRDPNGYVIELTAKLPGHDAAMDPRSNGAREKLERWQAARAATA